MSQPIFVNEHASDGRAWRLSESIENYFAWITWQGTPAEIEAAYDLAVTYGHWHRMQQIEGLLPSDRIYAIRRLIG